MAAAATNQKTYLDTALREPAEQIFGVFPYGDGAGFQWHVGSEHKNDSSPNKSDSKAINDSLTAGGATDSERVVVLIDN